MPKLMNGLSRNAHEGAAEQPRRQEHVSAEPVMTVEASLQRCPKHKTALLIVKVSRRAPAGLWCHEGHAPRLWDIVDARTGRVMARGSINGPVPLGPSRPLTVWLSGYSCLCVRCGYAWFAPCECEVKESAGQPAKHGDGCAPPARCSGCDTRNWSMPRRIL